MSTKDNLAAAFAGESQANRKYLMFAEQAEKDGFKGVAKLFRATAEAETIHAFAEFRANGGVGTTAENLQAAINGETYEFSEMYPPMIKEAEAEGDKTAARVFHFATRGREVPRAALQRGPRRHGRSRGRLLSLPDLRLHPQGQDRGQLPHLRREGFDIQEVLVFTK